MKIIAACIIIITMTIITTEEDTEFIQYSGGAHLGKHELGRKRRFRKSLKLHTRRHKLNYEDQS
jgi:hypothetical protein